MIRLNGIEHTAKAARDIILYLAGEIAKEENSTAADVLMGMCPSFESMPEEEPAAADTVLIPEWAMGVIHNDDFDGLGHEEIELINAFYSKYPGAVFAQVDGEAFFSHRPEFGLACNVIEHKVHYP